jgi:phenylalanyl-tRNA synthetase alpha chain
MIAQLDALLTAALAEIPSLTDDVGVEELRLKYLGKKGSVTLLSAGMRDVPPDQKAAVGAKLNEARTGITAALEERKLAIQAAAEAAEAAKIDLTLPSRAYPRCIR